MRAHVFLRRICAAPQQGCAYLLQVALLEADAYLHHRLRGPPAAYLDIGAVGGAQHAQRQDERVLIACEHMQAPVGLGEKKVLVLRHPGLCLAREVELAAHVPAAHQALDHRRRPESATSARPKTLTMTCTGPGVPKP